MAVLDLLPKCARFGYSKTALWFFQIHVGEVVEVVLPLARTLDCYEKIERLYSERTHGKAQMRR